MSPTEQVIVLLLAPGIPLLLALLLMMPRGQRVGRMLAPVAAAPALGLVALGRVDAPLSVSWLTLEARVGLDRTGLVFLFFTSLIWLLAGLYARRSLASDPDRVRFLVYFLFAMAGNLGLIIAQDMVLFYVCFALMSFATYGLVVHRGRPQDRQAGRIYVAFVVVGEMALFTALLLGHHAAASLEFAQVRIAVAEHPVRDLFLAMVVIGFGIKSGAITLHLWMPLAYRAAPIPAAGALSGAMFAAGLFGWLRLLPLGDTAAPEWGSLLVIAGLAAAFFGVIVGLTQYDPKALLAYSSMSQMGLMTAGLGASLAAPQAWPMMLAGLVVFALHHALVKAALFLGLGVARAANTSQIWPVGIGLLLPSLALAGLPGTSGLLAKAMLKTGAVAAGVWGSWLYAALPWSSLATTLLVSRFIWLAWPRPSAQAGGAPRGIWVPWSMLLVAVAGASWWVPGVEVEGLWARESLLGGFWPVALGALVSALIAWLNQRGRWRLSVSLPPGDLLVPLSSVAERLVQGASWLGHEWLPGQRQRVLRLLQTEQDSAAHTLATSRMEARITRWPLGIGFYLLLAIALAAMMLALQE